MKEVFVSEAQIDEDGSIVGTERLFDAAPMALPQIFPDQLIEGDAIRGKWERILQSEQFSNNFLIQITDRFRFEMNAMRC